MNLIKVYTLYKFFDKKSKGSGIATHANKFSVNNNDNDN